MKPTNKLMNTVVDEDDRLWEDAVHIPKKKGVLDKFAKLKKNVTALRTRSLELIGMSEALTRGLCQEEEKLEQVDTEIKTMEATIRYCEQRIAQKQEEIAQKKHEEAKCRETKHLLFTNVCMVNLKANAARGDLKSAEAGMFKAIKEMDPRDGGRMCDENPDLISFCHSCGLRPATQKKCVHCLKNFSCSNVSCVMDFVEKIEPRPDCPNCHKLSAWI